MRHACLHAQTSVAEDERAEREREADLALVAQADDDTVAVVADLDVLEHPLVAVDGQGGLLAVDGLDVDVAARDGDLEREREGGVEAVLEHPQAP